jgi:hypothetical protein
LALQVRKKQAFKGATADSALTYLQTDAQTKGYEPHAQKQLNSFYARAVCNVLSES